MPSARRSAIRASRGAVRRYDAAVRRILIRAWDPIGVADVPEAQDEYDSYVAGVCSRLIRKVPRQELFDYLWHVETECKELGGDRERTGRVVDLLLELPDQPGKPR